MSPGLAPPLHFQPRSRAPFLSETERRVLDALRRHGAVSRADLARLTGLAKPSVSRIVEDLIGRGFVVSGSPRVNGRGKPGLDVSLVREAAFCFGVSLMTDAFTVTLMDMSGHVHAEIVEAHPEMIRARLMKRLGEVFDVLIDTHLGDRSRVFGIGLAVTGFFVGEANRVNPPDPLEDFALIDLKALFEDEFGLPTLVENDGSAAAVGEALNGIGATYDRFAYLYFSAGFGGGLILDGLLSRGRFGNAGEFAGILVHGDRYPAPNLERLRQAVAVDGPRFDTLNAFLAAFDVAWPGVETWTLDVMDSLALVCGAIHATLDVEAIVLGGRIPTALAVDLIERIPMKQTPRRDLIRPSTTLILAQAPGDTTSAGAAALLFKQVFF